MDGEVPLDLRRLRYFVAVVEAGSFTAAARALHIAQPPLSRQVGRLEQDVGVALFRRRRPPLVLTPAGELLLERARDLLGDARRAIDEVRALDRGGSGQLRVGYVGSLVDAVAQAVREHCGASTGRRVALRQATTWHLARALAAGELDLAFVAEPQPLEAVHKTVVGTLPLRAALARSHRLAPARRLELADLVAEPWVLLERPDVGLVAVVLAACREAGFHPAVAQRAPDVDTLLALVAAGIGVTLVPQGAEELGVDGIAFRPVAGAPAATIVALEPPRPASPVAMELIDRVRSSLGRPGTPGPVEDPAERQERVAVRARPATSSFVEDSPAPLEGERAHAPAQP